MVKKETITVKGTEITLFSKSNEDYISLTDMAKYRNQDNPSQIISLWLRTYNTIEYIGLWEMLNNPNFKPHIFEGFKKESAKPSFWISPQKWISETNSIGIISKSGRYGGETFTHRCDKRTYHSTSGYKRANYIHLCRRSRLAQRSTIWVDGKTVT